MKMARSSHARNERLPLPTFSPTKTSTRRQGLSTKLKEFAPKQTGSQSKPYVTSSGIGPSGKISGCVKWFDVKKGYGFLRSDVVGDVDIFVHQRDIHADGVRILLPGEKVEFQLEREADGRFRALFVTGPNGSFVYGAESVNRIRSGRVQPEGEDQPVPFWYGPPNPPAIGDCEPRQIPFPVFPTSSNLPFWNPIPSAPALPPYHPGWGAPVGSIVMPPYAEYAPYLVRPYLTEDTGTTRQSTPRKPIPQGQLDSTSTLLKSLDSVEARDLDLKATSQSHRETPLRSKVEAEASPSETPQERRRITSGGIKAILGGIERDGSLKTDNVTGSWRSVPETLEMTPSPISSEVQSISTTSPAASITSSNSTPVSLASTTDESSDSSPATKSQSSSPSLSNSPVVSVCQGKVLALPLKASERGVYLKKGKEGRKRWETKLKSAQDTIKENPESTVWMLNDGVFSLGDDARILREMGFTHIVWIPE